MSMPYLEWLSFAVWLWAAESVRRTRVVARDTSLTTVRPWISVAVLLWIVVAASGLTDSGRQVPWRGYLIFLAAVMSLAPPMAVLGARRPTCRIWPAFVLLPMVVVLSWPVVSIGAATNWSRPLELELPQVAMFALVVVMSFGNYVGTRLSGPALLAAAALVSIPLAQSRWLTWSPEARESAVSVAVCLLATAVIRTCRIVRRRNETLKGLDRVWADFVTLFGLVWSRRLLDRLQIMAAKQEWSCRVTPTGFVWPNEPDARTEAAVQQSLRWLLRRFMDPVWLDERLGANEHHAGSPPQSMDLRCGCPKRGCRGQ